MSRYRSQVSEVHALLLFWGGEQETEIWVGNVIDGMEWVGMLF